MANQEKIIIEILAGSAGGICSCEGCAVGGCCGTADYSAITKRVAEELQKQYGDRVEVKYIDIDESGLDDYPKLRNILSVGYKLPITVINGKPRLAGGVSLEHIRKLIEEVTNEPQD
ncbi:MAG: hypothetical protein GXZ09_04965 [Syntrophomonadaceae bacterium]|nr:hypothetical protein [Syntrophomonadaceae bacterium]